eukprot:359694-Chlamydomonas_euryale.AAC.1
MPPRSPSDRAAFERLLGSLATMARRQLGRYSGTELADTVYGLGQLGSLDPAFMDDVLKAAGRCGKALRAGVDGCGRVWAS